MSGHRLQPFDNKLFGAIPSGREFIISGSIVIGLCVDKHICIKLVQETYKATTETFMDLPELSLAITLLHEYFQSFHKFPRASQAITSRHNPSQVFAELV